MKENLRIIGMLTGVCMLCGFLLAFIYNSARDRIEQNEKEYIYRAIRVIAADASSVSETNIDGTVVYRLSDENGRDSGYAFLCEGQGYQGKIKILFATDTGLSVLKGIEIIESSETPGLGARINEEGFKKYFSGLDMGRQVECVKGTPDDANQIEAITSATVSSKAVVKIVNNGIHDLKILLEHE